MVRMSTEFLKTQSAVVGKTFSLFLFYFIYFHFIYQPTNMYPLRPFVSIMLHLSAFHAIDECTFIYFLKFKYHKSK